MSKIYIASSDVVFGYEHLYLVYDPDNDPTNENEFIIRGGPNFASTISTPIKIENNVSYTVHLGMFFS